MSQMVLVTTCSSTYLPYPLAHVIGSVVTEVVSLSEVQVTVTLSDNGGQPVEEYTVSFVLAL